MNYATCPNIQDFHSTLNGCGVSQEDYSRGKLIFNTLCNTMEDYYDLYLKTDVLLLADDMCMKNYQFDPACYITAPGFSWDAMLKMTGVVLTCFDDTQQEMLEMTQQGMRGGISMITHRYAKANNPYILECYDETKAREYILFLDANNLYGYAMSQPLPIGDFAWSNEREWTADRIMSVKADDATGYIFKVDLDYPQELHDLHNDYPLERTDKHNPSPFIQNIN